MFCCTPYWYENAYVDAADAFRTNGDSKSTKNECGGFQPKFSSLMLELMIMRHGAIYYVSTEKVGLVGKINPS